MKAVTTCSLITVLSLGAAQSASAALVVAADYTFDGGTPAGATLNGDATISGGSLNLDGDGDYLSIASPLSATDNFAIEATFTITALPGFSFVAYNGNGSNNGGAGIVQIESDIQGILPGVPGGFLTPTSAATLNVEMTYSIIRQAGDLRAYVNGVEIDILNDLTPGTTIDLLYIGAGQGAAPEGFFSGSIDRVRLSTFESTDQLGLDQDGYIQVVPEPGSLALLGLGSLLVGHRRRD